MNKEESKSARTRTGWLVFVSLAVLTIIEFLIGAYVQPSALYLTITAIIKGWMIVHYFMHIMQLRRKDSQHK